MKKDIVVTDGEKLKAIREKYKLKQSDLSGTDITRNLLSEIETGKAVITKNVAEIVIKNLKEVARRRGLKVTETVGYLTENTVTQAEKILDGYITKLKRLLISKDEGFIETLKCAKGFLADWSINQKAVLIYDLAGDYYYINNEMYESILYYEKALTAIGRLTPSPELLNIFLKISKAYIHAGKYDKEIESCTFVIDTFHNLEPKDIFHFTYNRAYTYYLIKKYELALADIEKIEGFVSGNDLQSYFMLLDTKAVCLCETNHHDKALKIYNMLLKVLGESDLGKRIVVLINIVETYLALFEKDKALDTFKKVQEELPFLINNKYESNIYFEVGNIYKELGNIDEAYKYYNRALDTVKGKKDNALTGNILYVMLENTSSIEIINNVKTEIFTLIAKQEKISAKLIHKLLDFYADSGDITSVREINHFALQFVA